MMIGKSLRSLFEVQKEFQNSITGTPLPEDNTAWFSYHMQAMVEELGEVLKADKRWKTHRNNTFDQEEKKKELADIFITIINLFLFSGIDSDEAYDLIAKKMVENFKRLREEQRGAIQQEI